MVFCEVVPVLPIIPATNKIIIRVVNKRQQEGVVRAVAGKWKDRRDLVDDLLKIREDEDDRLNNQGDIGRLKP